MKKLLPGFIAVGLLVFVVACGGSSDSGSTTTDSITITSVSPSSGLTDGEDTNFTVTVEYTLDSADQGELSIGFNSDSVSSYSMIADVVVSSGSGAHTFNVSATAKNWGSEGDFEVYVNLYEINPSDLYTPYASDTQALSF